MKISKKMKELVDRANELCFPNTDDEFFVTLSVCPLISAGGGFQVWFDKWHLNGLDPDHLGTFLDLAEEKTLAKALQSLETSLEVEQIELCVKTINVVPPKEITQNGHKYKLVG